MSLTGIWHVVFNYLTTLDNYWSACAFKNALWQVSRMFGLEDELTDDALGGKLEGMKDVIERVNTQFRDPVSFGPFSVLG